MKKTAFVMLLALFPLMTFAQGDDFELWTSVGVSKKINERWNIGAEVEMRTRNDSKTLDRWDGGIEAEYKLSKIFELSAGYVFLYDNNKEKISYHSDGSYNNWRPHYWATRHRVNFAVTAGKDFGRFSVSLREMWQYTYRPEKTNDRYDFDNEYWENTTVNGKGKNVLRSRLEIDYNIKHCKVNPYVSAEIYNGWSLEKSRYTLGADWKFDKRNSVGMFYRYQNVNGSDDDNDYNSHIIGLAYKHKF